MVLLYSLATLFQSLLPLLGPSHFYPLSCSYMHEIFFLEEMSSLPHSIVYLYT